MRNLTAKGAFILIAWNNFINIHYTSFVLLYLNFDSTAIKIILIITNDGRSTMQFEEEIKNISSVIPVSIKKLVWSDRKKILCSLEFFLFGSFHQIRQFYLTLRIQKQSKYLLLWWK